MLLLFVASRGHGVVLVIVRGVNDIVHFPSTTMATPEAALKLEIARLTGMYFLSLC